MRVSKNFLGQYRKKVDSGGVPGKGIILASIEKLFRRVPETGQICVSTKKGSNHCEYRKIVESGRELGKGRIRPSIEKLSGRVPKKGRISVSTENGRIRERTGKR